MKKALMESRGQQRICERENKKFPRSTQMQTSSLAAMAASVGYGQQTIDSLVAMEALLDMSSPAVNAVQSMSQPPELQLPSSNATPIIASSTTGTVDKTSKVPFKNEQSMSTFATNDESLQGGQIVRPLAVFSSCVVPNKSESETVMNRTKKMRKMSESLTDDKIRKHEIEAALRSKSQRGRKRENLSVEERQELTRTRNREHAKTTRIRKKQRHDELVKVEKEHLNCIRKLSFIAARRACIDNFVKIRSIYMREVLLGRQAPASIVDSDYINCSASPHRRLEGDSNLKQNSPLHPKTNLGNSLYSEVISSTEDFEIKVCSVPFGIESEIRCSTRSTLNLEEMSRYDQLIAIKLSQKFGPSVLSKIEYVVQGSIEDIAITASLSRGFASFYLLSVIEQKPVIFSSGIMRFIFSNENGKIMEVESWFRHNENLRTLAQTKTVVSVGDFCGLGLGRDVGSNGSDSQVSEAPVDGPGMTI